jgi:formamidopyrimidine-DNA glycosylase
MLLKFIEIVYKLMASLRASERRGVEFKKSTKIFKTKEEVCTLARERIESVNLAQRSKH